LNKNKSRNENLANNNDKEVKEVRRYPFQKSGPDLGALRVKCDGQVAIVASVFKVLLGSLPGIGDGLEAEERFSSMAY
jgi:hypothetical protein